MAVVLPVKTVVGPGRCHACAHRILGALRLKPADVFVCTKGLQQHRLDGLNGVEHVAAYMVRAPLDLVAHRLAVVITVRCISLLTDLRIGIGVGGVNVALKGR